MDYREGDEALGAESNTAFIWAFLICLGAAAYIIVSVVQPLWPLKSRRPLIRLAIGLIVMGPLALALTAPPSPTGPTVEETTAAIGAVSTSTPIDAAAPAAASVVQVADKGSPTESPSNLEIAGLTHHNKAMGKKLTYRQPLMERINKDDLPADDWTIKEDHTDVICFADGNNAVFFTIGDRIYAANGKARQFVRHEDGDGVVLKDGTVVPVYEVDRSAHGALAAKAIDIGLDLCGQKSLDEIAQAAEDAVNSDDAEATTEAREDALIDAALAIIGAEKCGYQLDPVPVVDFLQSKGISNNDFKAEFPQFATAAKVLLSSADKSFCEKKILPKFGPEGMGFVSRE